MQKVRKSPALERHGILKKYVPKKKRTIKKRRGGPDGELPNPKQELFCWLYAGYHNADLFGNGTRCYMQAYGYIDEIAKINRKIDDLRATRPEGYTVMVDRYDARIKSMRNIAAVGAHTFLIKPNIRARVDYLVDQYIGNDYTDRELQFVIMQRKDLNSKVAAIREFNRLKSRGGAGKFEGEVTFSWEGDDEPKKSASKGASPPSKPKGPPKSATVKMSVKQPESTVEWET